MLKNKALLKYEKNSIRTKIKNKKITEYINSKYTLILSYSNTHYIRIRIKIINYLILILITFVLR